MERNKYVCKIVCIKIVLVVLFLHQSFSYGNPGYKPVEDPLGYPDNFLYEEWCKVKFGEEEGVYIYKAYKEIAFNIKYTPEVSKIDFWQTPIETADLKKGDCEDAVFLFFSHLRPYQKNAEIVWGWVINKRNSMGRAHVWYQLTDNRGRQYIVEGFSKDWNGIIPMEIVEETESRRPIFTISHSAVSRLASSLSGANDQQLYQSLIDLLGAADSTDDANTQDGYTTYHGYPTGRQMLPDVNKEISNILKKLHKLFVRYEQQMTEMGVKALE